MLMEGLGRQLSVEPILLAFRIVEDVGISYRREFTGSVLRRVSGGVRAIDHDLSIFIWDQSGGLALHLIWRQVLRSRKMHMVIGVLGKRLEEDEVFAAVEL